jgi:hypothetical protein
MHSSIEGKEDLTSEKSEQCSEACPLTHIPDEFFFLTNIPVELSPGVKG